MKKKNLIQEVLAVTVCCLKTALEEFKVYVAHYRQKMSGATLRVMTFSTYALD